MKFFSFVFSFYLLTLSLLPCNDSVECGDLTTTTISQTDKHENHSHETEQCTPFCVCACCGVHAFQQPSILLFKENVVLFDDEKQKTVYTSFYSNDVATKIWQPPQIS